MTIHVSRTGVLGVAGHDHEITAPIARGTVDLHAHKVDLQVKAAGLRVVDAKASEKDRTQIQATMVGPEVLNIAQFPEIRFQSTAARQSGAGVWNVTGKLMLHGRTAPVTVEVRESNGEFSGAARFRQTEFGMTPVSIAGGAVKVKDEVEIRFQIRLAVPTQ
jgi:polyisoprenoid-binding protein YceI